MSFEQLTSTWEKVPVTEALDRFGLSTGAECPDQDFTGEREVRLYRGGLRIAGNLAPEADSHRIPYDVIVDGDLTIDADLDWWDEGSGGFFLVTGNLRARNVLLSGCPNVVVGGDLVVAGRIQGHHGQDRGRLVVKGRTRAQIVVNTLFFTMSFAARPEAVVAADPCRTSCPVDFTADELADIVLPELLDKGQVDEHRISRTLRAGEPILRPGIQPRGLRVLKSLGPPPPGAVEATEPQLPEHTPGKAPAPLLAFRHLRYLSLAGDNDPGILDDHIGELTALEELDISGMGLTRLPEAIGRLRNLRVLDISGNRFEALPDELGDLSRLEVLRAARLTCPLPDSIAGLQALRTLDLASMCPRQPGSPVDFPWVVTRLSGLRSLDLSGIFLSEIPDELIAMTSLEELDLRGSLSAHLRRLPELARLPSLRVLRLSGVTRWPVQPEPSGDLLTSVWDIRTLEELDISGWGGRTLDDRRHVPR
ncbi:leucine-rich repeat domain-containing protein [Wenjunlia tyrosinilytica]|uniref:Disease resistance R13L4/SHOC-2-like LRR domain-containing protein n=1 Tax=Wenjunlia tyrosinilytica TaxID=1544741 RepID=A0A917ZWL0_9ACTN|nr:leucine-rich repeat domain-containing protein [Wenjunlia tyrosinilytica]GGO95616.1 hypothetical protein GCM10012280_53220 [Wenjunlia tyrosinilytica]